MTIGGEIVAGAVERLRKLKELNFALILFTGNTRNDADMIAGDLGIDWKLAKTASEKHELAEDMGPDTCVAIGNGLIDAKLMTAVGLYLYKRSS